MYSYSHKLPLSFMVIALCLASFSHTMDKLNSTNNSSTTQNLQQKLARLCIAHTGSTDITPRTQAESLTQTDTPTHTRTSDMQTQVDTPIAWTFFSKSRQEDPDNADISLTEKALIELINQEKTHIRASLFEFNLYRVAYALCQAHARGIPVEIVINASRGTKRSVAQLLLQHCGIPIRYYTPSTEETHDGGGILHTKMFVFEQNTGTEFLNTNVQRLQANDVPTHPTALFWTGSTNIAGNAVEKNMETSSVLADEQSVHLALERFQTMWNAAEKQQKTEKKRNDLEGVEINKTDEVVNGVPSVNTLLLLQSSFRREQDGGISYVPLTAQEILHYQEFEPTFMATSTEPKPRLLPKNLTLTKSSFFSIGQDAKMYICGKDMTTWYNLHDNLEIQTTLKLHGIAKPVQAKLEEWFFKTAQEGRETYYSLKQLQEQPQELENSMFYGPYIKIQQDTYQQVVLKRLRKDESYTLQELQTTPQEPHIRTPDGLKTLTELILTR